ncbi:Hypothetical_protein [Hexamita inflata]|uniref:Hypothetical_protein n=1 Tax=Hexamita inflata TaxID=28002 RepID=A0AA86QK68_9EUKA|nr:Hypothetical protein HINF_LOCUS47473 [Hexamita inflata]
MLGMLIKSATMLKLVLCAPITKNISQSLSFINFKNIMYRNAQNVNYCTKEYSLSSRVQTGSIILSPASAEHFSLYTTTTQNLILILTYQIQNLPSFALFGLTRSISLQNSQISVKVPQILSQGSLLCFACDVNANASDFTFVASGQNVSGVATSPLTVITLNQSLVQFRLNGMNVGGLILNAFKIAVSISQCNISGYVSQYSVSGSIICFVIEQVSLEVDSVRTCTNIKNLWQGTLTQTGAITINCIVCREGSPTYGLCQKSLEFGIVEDDKFVCLSPFIFDGERCSCKEGDVLNGTLCINILTSVNLFNTKQIENNKSIQDLNNRTKVLENTTEIQNVQMNQDVQNLYQLSNTTHNIIANNYTQLQQYIQDNYTQAEVNFIRNTSILDKIIFDNVYNLSNQISTVKSYSSSLNTDITQLNLTIKAQITQNSWLAQNITLLKETLAHSNDLIQHQHYQINNLCELIKCLNNQDQQNISGTCYIVNNEDDDKFTCSQKVYLAQFDVSIITHVIKNFDNFSNGYVFASDTDIQNAFVDVSDYVYSTFVYPLFQSQSTFTNLKIQFGAQTLNSGSFIISSVQSIIINQMNIISRPGSQLTVNANSQLNILTDSPSDAIIHNLLVNLSLDSYGNITLINNINNILNISKYQVIGDYISNSIVAMIGIHVQSATIHVNHVNFRPSAFNVGNGSSYLFGSSESENTITLIINHFAVIIGNRLNFLLLGSISTTDDTANYYLFGGVIAFVQYSVLSNIIINNVVFDSYQNFNTMFVSQSGFLVGSIYDLWSSVTINNVCILQNMTSTTNFRYFGLGGSCGVNTFIYNASVTFSVQGESFSAFGIIGGQGSSYAEVKNLRTSVSVNSISQPPQDIGNVVVGIVFGSLWAKNCTILNTTVIGGNIVSSQCNCGIFGILFFNTTIINSSISYTNISGYNVGGIIGWQFEERGETIIRDSAISNMNIFGSNCVGGVIGLWECQFPLYLINLQINLVHLSCSGIRVGIVVGYSYNGTYSFTNSIARSNFINGVKQTECANLSNTWSITGC